MESQQLLEVERPGLRRHHEWRDPGGVLLRGGGTAASYQLPETSQDALAPPAEGGVGQGPGHAVIHREGVGVHRGGDGAGGQVLVAAAAALL